MQKGFLNLKLKSKFMLSYIIIILFTVAMISIINFKLSESALKGNTSAYSEYLMEQISMNMESRTKDMEDYIFMQFTYSGLNKFMQNKSDDNGIGSYQKKRSIDTFINNMLNSKFYIQSVMIIDKYNFRYYKSKNGETNEKYISDYIVDMDKVNELWGQTYWKSSKDGLIYMQRMVFDPDDTQYLGVIVVGIKSEYLKELYKNIDRVSGGKIVILDNQNNILASDDQLSVDISKFLTGGKSGKDDLRSKSFIYSGDEYISTVWTSNDDKWKILNIITVKELSKVSNTLKLSILATCMVSLMIALLIAVLISKNITDSIRHLIKNIRKIAEGNFSTRIHPISYDEVGLLALEFNSMAEKISDLINTVFNEKLQKKNAEYKALQFEYNALQAQMNPHFLYNTLETINSMAKLHGEKDISEMIYLLAYLLKESLKRKNNIVRLKDEIQYIRNYVEIQKKTYGDKFEIEYDIDKEIMDNKVPKFILQPIIENAIMHGVLPKPGKGIILVSVYKNDKYMFVEVMDNGVGIDRPDIDRILEYDEDELPEKEHTHTKIGIHSVDKRIKILFGDEYGIHISSEAGKGTKVQIILPLDTAERMQGLVMNRIEVDPGDI